jgi:hypothetical protein
MLAESKYLAMADVRRLGHDAAQKEQPLNNSSAN